MSPSRRLASSPRRRGRGHADDGRVQRQAPCRPRKPASPKPKIPRRNPPPSSRRPAGSRPCPRWRRGAGPHDPKNGSQNESTPPSDAYAGGSREGREVDRGDERRGCPSRGSLELDSSTASKAVAWYRLELIEQRGGDAGLALAEKCQLGPLSSRMSRHARRARRIDLGGRVASTSKLAFNGPSPHPGRTAGGSATSSAIAGEYVQASVRQRWTRMAW